LPTARSPLSAATDRLGLGDKIRLIPGHATRPSTSMTGVRVRGTLAEQIWPITARGAVY
jgi:hypothetical protein